jgi:hypothetical protein
MSTIPANKIEHNGDHPDGRNHVCARPADHICGGQGRHCFAVGDGT